MTRRDLPPLPHNREAEESLLGVLLDDVDAFRNVQDVVDADDFYRPDYGMVFRAVADVVASGQKLDVLAVRAQMKVLGHADALPVLSELSARRGAGGAARHYAALVRDAALSRRVILGAHDVARAAYQESEPPAELAHRLAMLAGQIAERAGTSGATIADLAVAVVSDAVAAFEGRRIMLRPQVCAALDDFVPPLGAGEMLVIGARPKAGKSHLAADLGYSYARQGAPGLVLSLEDPPTTWVRREMAKIARLDAEDVRGGRLDVVGWHALNAAGAEAAKLPVEVEWMGGRRACDLAGRIAFHARRRGIKWAIVDYVQLVRPSSIRRGSSREEETSQVVDEIKAAAGAAGVGLVVCSQLRRLAPGEQEPRPNASDLRNSGMIEAQADAVLLIWRRDRTDYSRAVLLLVAYKHGAPDERALIWLPHRFDYRLDTGGASHFRGDG